ncbi:hypothetical protein LguiB_012875 [Lonicera macranthoides]
MMRLSWEKIIKSGHLLFCQRVGTASFVKEYIVGTGGDGANTVNVSTGTSILAAACRAKVAKQGKRSSSSAWGSADVNWGDNVFEKLLLQLLTAGAPAIAAINPVKSQDIRRTLPGLWGGKIAISLELDQSFELYETPKSITQDLKVSEKILQHTLIVILGRL